MNTNRIILLLIMVTLSLTAQDKYKSLLDYFKIAYK